MLNEYKMGERIIVTSDAFYGDLPHNSKGVIIKVDGRINTVLIDNYDYTDWDETGHIFYPYEISIEGVIPIDMVCEEELLPKYQSHKSAGADLKADIKESVIIKPWQRAVIPTGVKIKLPIGYEGQVRPRSGLAAKQGLTVLNSPGTIDEDYRGEIKVILINLSEKDVEISPNMRIAQLVIAPYTQGKFSVVSDLDATERGEGGLGSTGTK